MITTLGIEIILIITQSIIGSLIAAGIITSITDLVMYENQLINTILALGTQASNFIIFMIGRETLTIVLPLALGLGIFKWLIYPFTSFALGFVNNRS